MTTAVLDDDMDEEGDPRALAELWQSHVAGMTYDDIAADAHRRAGEHLTPTEIAAAFAAYAAMIEMGMSAPPGTADAIRDDLRRHGFEVDHVAAMQAVYDEEHGIKPVQH